MFIHVYRRNEVGLQYFVYQTTFFVYLNARAFYMAVNIVRRSSWGNLWRKVQRDPSSMTIRRADTRFAFSSEPTSSNPGCFRCVFTYLCRQFARQLNIVWIAIKDFLLNILYSFITYNYIQTSYSYLSKTILYDSSPHEPSSI